MHAHFFRLLSAVPLLAPVTAEVEVRELVVGPAEPNHAFGLSVRGVHTAALVAKGSRWVVLVDGVEGPKFDQLLHSAGPAQPISFTEDGLHHAYAARIANEFILVHDGREVFRGAWVQPEAHCGKPDFSPGGKRLYFTLTTPEGTALVVDGVRGPWCRELSAPVFSPDGMRFAYSAKKVGAEQPVLIVDGQDADYHGTDLQFTADSKHLLTLARLPDQVQLLVDGQLGGRGHDIQKVCVPPAGNGVAVVYGSTAPGQGGDQFLVVGGKRVEGSECLLIEKVVFSPDGKRVAALCQSRNGTQFVVADGKKGLEYSGVTELQFTPDSSRVLYVGRTAQSFLVIGDEESDGYASIQPPFFAADGKRIGFCAMGADGKTWIVVDGKPAQFRGASELQFTSDGARYAFLSGQGLMSSLYLDGVEQPGVGVLSPMNPQAGSFALSPDGKHAAYFGLDASDPGRRGVFCDGKLVSPVASQAHRLPRFSPDGRHLFWVVPGQGGFELYVDGERAVGFDNESRIENTPFNWQFDADGALVFVAVSGGSIKRFRVMPPEGSSIDVLVAAAR